MVIDQALSFCFDNEEINHFGKVSTHATTKDCYFDLYCWKSLSSYKLLPKKFTKMREIEIDPVMKNLKFSYQAQKKKKQIS